MEIIAHLYCKDINKCFDYSYSKINNGVFSEIETPTNLKFSDKKVIPADLIMILSQYFRFVGVSISENTPLLIFEYE